jgi:hypothetical protein
MLALVWATIWAVKKMPFWCILLERLSIFCGKSGELCFAHPLLGYSLSLSRLQVSGKMYKAQQVL